MRMTRLASGLLLRSTGELVNTSAVVVSFFDGQPEYFAVSLAIWLNAKTNARVQRTGEYKIRVKNMTKINVEIVA